MSTTYFGILSRDEFAEDDVDTKPLGLRLSFDLKDVMGEVRKHWPKAYKVRVLWDRERNFSDLTDKNCQATLDLLMHRGRMDVLLVYFKN